MPDAPGTVRVVALMDGSSVTGPAKNLIGFARRALDPPPGLPRAEVRIVTIQRGAANAFVAAVRQAGLPVETIAERRAFDPAVLPRLCEAVKSCRPDIIQTHNYKSHFLVRLTGLCRCAPWVAFHHGYTATSLRVRGYNQLDRWSLRAARRVVTVCGPFARELERMGVPASRISVRHNSVLPFAAPAAAEVEALRARLAIPPQARVILTVGRLSREKAHRDLLEAVALLRRRRPSLPLRLIVAGDGPERAALERLVVSLGLSDSVVLAGHQADVRPYYAMAGVFALPSHSEGSPNVLLEAMSAGVPCVATAVGGVPEIAAHLQTALLVERGRPASLAESIGRLLEDPDLAVRLGAAARRAAAAFAPEAYCRSILDLYRELLA